MEMNSTRGTCMMMCPKKEALLRQKKNLLHKFEMKKGTECNRCPEYDPEKIVKCFSRSAAGTQTAEPENLRPFPILLKTIEYLYREIFPLHDEKPLTVYNFMFDRFRAIRQDAAIQNLLPSELILILEPIVRFLIYFSYVLAEEKISDFDDHINNKHIQECLKTLLVCYDDSDDEGKNRWDMESAYLLFNLGNTKPLVRGIKLCELTKNQTYTYSLRLSFQWQLKNYARVCEMIKKLPPLLLCIANNSVPEIRTYAYKAMCHAFSCANSAYPVSQLKKLLLYENNTGVIDDCSCFKIKVNDSVINFLKKDFDMTAQCNQRVRLKWISDVLSKYDLLQLLCFGETCTLL